MTPQPDPYRTLGVTPGATINEIRSAYRRLAKQYHPDAGGERALPRFLAIQAAYERLVDGEGRLRPTTGGPTVGGPMGGAPREPWRADPARARASRDAWRARRSTSSSGPAGDGDGSGTGGGGRGGASGGAPGPTPPGGRTGGAGSAAPGSTRSRTSAGRGPADRRPRATRTARPGSTSYDEAAAAPRDPSWDGGDWYGPSSGTYWTINPREYADPRKHGPEYQARAKRVAGERGPAGSGTTDQGRDPDTDPNPDTDRETPPPAARRPFDRDREPSARRERGAEPGRGPTGRTPGWSAGRPGGYADEPAAAPARSREPVADLPTFPDLEALARRFAPSALLALARRPDPRWRLLLAVAGWPPIGLALGSLLMEVSGCGRFAASCPPAAPVAAWLVQPAVVAALLLVPALAAVTAFASVAALAVAVPVAAVLAVGTVPDSRVGAPVLAVAVGLAWLAGLAAATRVLVRARTSLPGP